MAYGQALLYDTMRTRDSATFTGSYQTLGTAITQPATIVKIVNNSGALVTVSTDGINDMDIIPANGFVLYDNTANTPSHGDDAIFIPKGTQYLVKGSASTGLVYLVVLYLKVL